jgi:putative hemolysin
MINQIILIFLFLLFVAIAGLFAGAETGVYQMSRLRLRLGVEHRLWPFVVLSKVLQDSSALLMSLLLGTNLSHYFATSIITFILLEKFSSEHIAELVAAAITVPMFFVFSELIPKNIFFRHADLLMPRVSFLLLAIHKFFIWCGVIPLLKVLIGVFTKVTGVSAAFEAKIAAGRQPYIKAIFQETQEEGLFSPTQTDLIKRLENISNLSIKSVMTPINKVQMVSKDSSREKLLEKLADSVFTRLPVHYLSQTNIVGFINIYECLASKEEFNDLDKFIKPIRKLSGDTIVTEAINVMQQENQKIMLVTKTSHLTGEKPIGIITMKDLVEELLGELAER